MSANPRWLIGRKITRVEMQPFKARPNAGKDSPIAHDPVLYLDNGAVLTFSVEETEVGEYGVSINYWAKGKLGSASKSLPVGESSRAPEGSTKS